MIVRHLYTPGLSINSYLVFDENTRNGAVIDPTMATSDIVAAAAKENILITDILETHVHADFLSGSAALKKALNGAPTIHCSGMGGKDWIPFYADRVVKDNDEVVLGSIRLQAKHTPGHTPEHMAWLLFDDNRSKTVPELLFSGDLLFVGSVGRPDLLGAHTEALLSRQLYSSIFDVLGSLPTHVEVLPAHGAGSPCGKEIGMSLSTTLGYEQACNPWLKKVPYEEWHEGLMRDVPGVPQYFPVMKRLNVTGIKHGSPERREVNKKEAMKLASKILVVDLRPYEVFSHGHIKGSINIPLLPAFPLWAGTILPNDKPMVLVGDSIQSCLKATELLQLIGMDLVEAFCDAGLWKEQSALEMSSMPLVSPDVVVRDSDDYYVVDVRSPTEWNSGHLPNAHHIELSGLPKMAKSIPKGKTIALICRSGSRASIAASFLRKEGFDRVCNIRGGMMKV
jgi:hydroxyacylglutathione hydrolase